MYDFGSLRIHDAKLFHADDDGLSSFSNLLPVPLFGFAYSFKSLCIRSNSFKSWGYRLCETEKMNNFV